MESKILTSYKYSSDSDLIAIIHRVLGKMEGNTNFPQPPAALDTLKKDLPDFIAAFTRASGGDKEMVAIKKAKRVTVIALLSELVEYISLTSQGDRAMLLSSGFPITRLKGDTSMPEIKDLQVTIGPPGEAVTRVKRVTGAKAYVHQYTIDPLMNDNTWVSKFVIETSFTFTGLQSKERYLFRVIAVGVKGQQAYSPPVARVIQ